MYFFILTCTFFSILFFQLPFFFRYVILNAWKRLFITQKAYEIAYWFSRWVPFWECACWSACSVITYSGTICRTLGVVSRKPNGCWKKKIWRSTRPQRLWASRVPSISARYLNGWRVSPPRNTSTISSVNCYYGLSLIGNYEYGKAGSEKWIHNR